MSNTDVSRESKQAYAAFILRDPEQVIGLIETLASAGDSQAMEQIQQAREQRDDVIALMKANSTDE